MFSHKIVLQKIKTGIKSILHTGKEKSTVTFMEKNTCTCSKCQLPYCTLHRLAEAHSCIHDFKEDVNKEKFIAENKCVKEKMIKI